MRPAIVIVDNYDSFTQNVVHVLITAGAECVVAKNDALTAEELLGRNADGYVISAGPCTPTRAGASLELVTRLGAARPEVPLLGLCLGMQAIGIANGAVLRRATVPMHGEVTAITHDGEGLFADIPSPLEAARYNSLVLEEASLSPTLEVSARDPAGDVMALRHRTLPHAGLQFHPESWLCPDAAALLHRWVEMTWLARQALLRQAPPR